MNRFIIAHGLPYLFAEGKTYRCRWDKNGFTLGDEIKLESKDRRIYSELSVMAQCAGHLDSIAESVELETQEMAKKSVSKRKKTNTD